MVSPEFPTWVHAFEEKKRFELPEFFLAGFQLEYHSGWEEGEGGGGCVFARKLDRLGSVCCESKGFGGFFFGYLS